MKIVLRRFLPQNPGLVDVLVFFVVILSVFQNQLTRIFGFFSYFDEFLSAAIFISGLVLYSIRRPSISKTVVLSCCFFLSFLILIFISTALHDDQPFTAIILDFVAIVKFPLSFFGSYLVFKSLGYRLEKNYLLLRFGQCLIILFSAYTILDLIFNFQKIGSQFLFFHPLYLLCDNPTFAVPSLIILLLMNELAPKGRFSLLLSILVCLMLVLTLRSKAYIFVGFFILLKIVKKKEYLFNPLSILCLSAASLGLGWRKFNYYWNTQDISARKSLLLGSVEVGQKFFPLGSGFGNYGSYVCQKYYPSLYVELGFLDVWGLSTSGPWFGSDSFWPLILGESGFFGFVFCSFSIAFLLVGVFQERKNFIAFCLPIVYLLISSIAESSFLNSYGPIFAFFIGICIHENEMDAPLALHPRDSIDFSFE